MTEANAPVTIEVTIFRTKGNKVIYEWDNDGTRVKLDKPYWRNWVHAKFKLPTGRRKTEKFSAGTTNEEALAAVQKKYSNFKFIMAEQSISGRQIEKTPQAQVDDYLLEFSVEKAIDIAETMLDLAKVIDHGKVEFWNRVLFILNSKKH